MKLFLGLVAGCVLKGDVFDVMVKLKILTIHLLGYLENRLGFKILLRPCIKFSVGCSDFKISLAIAPRICTYITPNCANSHSGGCHSTKAFRQS